MDEEQPKIGSQLKIKLPNDFNKVEGSKPLNMDDISKMFAQSSAWEEIGRKLYEDDLLYSGYVPPTKWQKFKYKLQRIKDAWDVLRGNKDVE